MQVKPQTAVPEPERAQTRALTGNEAIARGAWEAGVRLAAAYPGTPSTEILESLAKYPAEDLHAQWSTNEKVALDVAFGASLAGHGPSWMTTLPVVGSLRCWPSRLICGLTSMGVVSTAWIGVTCAALPKTTPAAQSGSRR